MKLLVITLLLLAVYCALSEGACGGSSSAPTQAACRRRTTYTDRLSYRLCKGSWWSRRRTCTTAFRTVIRYKTSYFCNMGYSLTGSRCRGTGGSRYGTWSAWNAWGNCSSSCYQLRSRNCSTSRCLGSRYQLKKCSTCQPNSGQDTWSAWGAWSNCSSTCSQVRSRNCSTSRCLGSRYQKQKCSTCDTSQGTWSAWGAWGNCSSSCWQLRSRKCSTTRCQGSSYQMQKCGSCDSSQGRWSAWGTWGNCSSTCRQIRSRKCSNSRCQGSSYQLQKCGSCVSRWGTWSVWGTWGNCSSTCLQTRSRNCSTSSCLGGGNQVQKCSTCGPASSTWSTWGPWSTCSVTCGTGSQRRTRRCVSATRCQGSVSENRYCKGGAPCLPGTDSGTATCGISKYTNAGQSYFSPAIVGGNTAKTNEYPWQVSLRSGPSMNSFFCGGSILNATAILTAAHCVSGSSTQRVLVFAGDHNLGVTESTEQVRAVRSIHVHPHYDPSTVHNDVAVIILATPLNLNADVAAACLPSAGTSVVGKEVVISGWGKIATNQPISSVLQYALVNVVSGSVCLRFYRTLAPDLLCVSDGRGDTVRSACFGDSGGPMVIKRNGRWTLVGVTSFVSSRGCAAGAPFGYRDVAVHLPFILSNRV